MKPHTEKIRNYFFDVPTGWKENIIMAINNPNSTFNPNDHLIKIKSGQSEKDYLPVQWRLVWFRHDFPAGTIETEMTFLDLDRETEEEISVWNSSKRSYDKVVKSAKGFVIFKATVKDGQGGVATGMKSEKAASFADFIEKAETGAIGRALAALGYGTQFTGDEWDEAHRIVDNPVDGGQGDGAAEKKPVPDKQADTQAASKKQPATDKQTDIGAPQKPAANGTAKQAVGGAGTTNEQPVVTKQGKDAEEKKPVPADNNKQAQPVVTKQSDVNASKAVATTDSGGKQPSATKQARCAHAATNEPRSISPLNQLYERANRGKQFKTGKDANENVLNFLKWGSQVCGVLIETQYHMTPVRVDECNKYLDAQASVAAAS